MKLLHSIMILNTISLPYKARGKNTHTHTHTVGITHDAEIQMDSQSDTDYVRFVPCSKYYNKIVSQALVSCNPMFYFNSNS